jgi:hypothetical protein
MAQMHARYSSPHAAGENLTVLKSFQRAGIEPERARLARRFPRLVGCARGERSGDMSRSLSLLGVAAHQV